MQDEQYESLPHEQKCEYLNVVTDDLIRIFLKQYKEHPLHPLLQAWCSVPLHVDTLMKNPEPICNEEEIDIICTRGNAASALLTILTNIFIYDNLSFRSPNLHITFSNKDGSTGSIVVDNLNTTLGSSVDIKTIKLVSC